MSVLFADAIEADVSGGTSDNDPTMTGGAWEQAEPNATIFGGGTAADEDQIAVVTALYRMNQ